MEKDNKIIHSIFKNPPTYSPGTQVPREATLTKSFPQSFLRRLHLTDGCSSSATILIIPTFFFLDDNKVTSMVVCGHTESQCVELHGPMRANIST